MTTTCQHHWMVDSPVMGEQQATCKLCGDRTVFRPVYTAGTFDQTSPTAERLSTFGSAHSIGKRSL